MKRGGEGQTSLSKTTFAGNKRKFQLLAIDHKQRINSILQSYAKRAIRTVRATLLHQKIPSGDLQKEQKFHPSRDDEDNIQDLTLKMLSPRHQQFHQSRDHEDKNRYLDDALSSSPAWALPSTPMCSPSPKKEVSVLTKYVAACSFV
jgi:hypothetical protein